MAGLGARPAQPAELGLLSAPGTPAATPINLLHLVAIGSPVESAVNAPPFPTWPHQPTLARPAQAPRPPAGHVVRRGGRA